MQAANTNSSQHQLFHLLVHVNLLPPYLCMLPNNSFQDVNAMCMLQGTILEASTGNGLANTNSSEQKRASTRL
jgi:hypothetical protein